jgi:hypothetical protein
MNTDFDSFTNRGEYLSAHYFADQLSGDLKKGSSPPEHCARTTSTIHTRLPGNWSASSGATTPAESAPSGRKEISLRYRCREDSPVPL